MDKKVQIKMWEKLIMRAFAAWCLSTMFGANTLEDMAGVRLLNILMSIVIIFALISLVDMLCCKYIQNNIVDIAFYSLSVILFGVQAVYGVKDPYFAVAIIVGVLICLGVAYRRLATQLVEFDYGKRISVLIVAFIAFAIFSLMSVLLLMRYKMYMTSTFDFGIFTQMFYNMKETGLPMTTCERNEWLSHFSVHVSPIFYLILPIYCLFPYNETLIIVQLLFLLSGVIPVYLICKNRKLNNVVTTIISVVYLLSPVLLSGLFYDFHENKFLTTLILWLMYFVDKNKKVGMYIFAVLVLMIKEDAGIYVACIGLYVLATKKGRKKLHGIIMFMLSVLWFMLSYIWLEGGGDGAMTYRYSNFIAGSDGSIFDILINIVKSPEYFFRQLLTVKKLENLLWLLVPVMFVPFKVKNLKPYILMIPFLVLNLMSNYIYQYDIAHQYYYGSFALMMYLVIINISKMEKENIVKVSNAMLLATLVMSCSVVTEKFTYFEDYKDNEEIYKTIDDTIESIPKDASVSATTYILPKLSMRKEIYRYPEGNGCDYVVYDMRDALEARNYKIQAEELLSDGYSVMIDVPDILLILEKD